MKKTVKKSYLDFEGIDISETGTITVTAKDPITGSKAKVWGYWDEDAQSLENVSYTNFGGGDDERFMMSVDLVRPKSFFRAVRDYLDEPIEVTPYNAQAFADTIANLPGVSTTTPGDMTAVFVYAPPGGYENNFFA